MAATYRSVAQNASYVTGTSGLTINKPSSVADGDTLVAFIGAGDDAGGAYACSGWSQASGTGSGAQATTTGNDIGSTVLYKYISNAAGEPSSYTFTNTDTASQNRSGFIVCVQNTDSSDPIDELTQGASTNDWTPNTTSITSGSDGCCLLFFHVGNIGTAAAKTAGAPSGTTLAGSIASSRTTSNYSSAEAAYYNQTSAGTFAATAWTGTPDDATSEWHVYSVAVRSSPLQVSVSDTVSSISDTPTVLVELETYLISRTDAVGSITDAPSAVVSVPQVLGTDATGSITDIPNATVSAPQIFKTETIGIITDTPSAQVGVQADVSDTVGSITDTPNVYVTPLEPSKEISTSDSIGILWEGPRFYPDDIIVTDKPFVQVGVEVSASQLINISDTASVFVPVLYVGVTEIIPVSDAPTVFAPPPGACIINVYEEISVADAVAAALEAIAVASQENISITEAMQLVVGTSQIYVTDYLAINETVRMQFGENPIIIHLHTRMRDISFEVADRVLDSETRTRVVDVTPDTKPIDLRTRLRVQSLEVTRE